MRQKSTTLFVCFLSVFLFIAWCWNKVSEEENLTSNSEDLSQETNLTSSLGNPVSQYCEDHWWTSEFRELADWNQLGTCFFEDWSYCDVWDYRSWSCNPGDNPVAKNNISNLSSEDKNSENLW